MVEKKEVKTKIGVGSVVRLEIQRKTHVREEAVGLVKRLCYVSSMWWVIINYWFNLNLVRRKK